MLSGSVDHVLFTFGEMVSDGCGEETMEDEKLVAVGLPVGAKPVKKPMTKQSEKWKIAFFHSRAFFFDDLSILCCEFRCLVIYMKWRELNMVCYVMIGTAKPRDVFVVT